MNFTEFDWNFLNSIIYQINRISNLDEMRSLFLNMLNTCIPSQQSVFFLPNKELYLSNPVSIGYSQAAHVLEDEQLENNDFFNQKWLFESAQNKVFRYSDYYTQKDMPLKKGLLAKWKHLDICYVVLVSLACEHQYVGCVILMRSYENGDFSDQEIRKLDILKDHLALRLYKEISGEKEVNWEEQIQIAIEQIAGKYHLTPREAEVLALILNGEQNDMICTMLSIAHSTLKKHTLSIYEKTGVNNKAGLIKIFNRQTVLNSSQKK